MAPGCLLKVIAAHRFDRFEIAKVLVIGQAKSSELGTTFGPLSGGLAGMGEMAAEFRLRQGHVFS